VYRDFYATLAQVMPVLLLALMWESGFLQRLGTQSRLLRKVDPAGVRWWTKPRVRVYALTINTVMIAATGASLTVLAGLLPDSPLLRAMLLGAVVLALATLLTRICVDVLAATTSGTTSAGDGSPPSDRSTVHGADGAEPDRVM
jgi:hypothetical protein